MEGKWDERKRASEGDRRRRNIYIVGRENDDSVSAYDFNRWVSITALRIPYQVMILDL